MRTGSSGAGRSGFSGFGVGGGVGGLAGFSFEAGEALRRLFVADFRAGFSFDCFLVGDCFLVRAFVMGPCLIRCDVGRSPLACCKSRSRREPISPHRDVAGCYGNAESSFLAPSRVVAARVLGELARFVEHGELTELAVVSPARPSGNAPAAVRRAERGAGERCSGRADVTRAASLHVHARRCNAGSLRRGRQASENRLPSAWRSAGFRGKRSRTPAGAGNG